MPFQWAVVRVNCGPPISRELTWPRQPILPPMQARGEAGLARAVRLFLRPRALLALGLACYAIGLLASAQAPLISHDLYIASSGAVCDGGSLLSTCWTVDPTEFHPALPDLSSYRSGDSD